MQFAHELIVPEVGFPFKLFLFEGREGHYHREKHWHRSIEIFAVCDGELEFKIDEKTWHLTAGEFMIVNSNEVHEVDSPLPNETIVLQIPLKVFEKYYTGEQAFDRSKITKSTSIDVNVTRNTSDASKVLFDQTAVITVTYHYDTVLSYPDYVKTTTLTTNTFEAEEREEDVSGTKQTVYYVSGKIK